MLFEIKQIKLSHALQQPLVISIIYEHISLKIFSPGIGCEIST